jgi:hypothetical protein
MDIVPTLLPLVGLDAMSEPSHGWVGLDLGPVASQDPGATAALEKRPIALGRTLQANDHWGVYLQGRKWISTGRVQQLYDLSSDPKERTDISNNPKAELAQYPEHLAKALKREVKRVIRVSTQTSRRTMLGKKSRIEATHPSGILSAWIANDAKLMYAKPVIEDGMVVVPVHVDKKTANELFILLPDGVEPTGLTVSRETASGIVKGTVGNSKPHSIEKPLLVVGAKNNGFTIDTSWQAVPGDTEGIIFQGEVTDDLRALGYID